MIKQGEIVRVVKPVYKNVPVGSIGKVLKIITMSKEARVNVGGLQVAIPVLPVLCVEIGNKKFDFFEDELERG